MIVTYILQKNYHAKKQEELKGYLRCNTIISQNVPSEAQVKNFLFHRKVMFHSQDIQVFVFLAIS